MYSCRSDPIQTSSGFRSMRTTACRFSTKTAPSSRNAQPDTSTSSRCRSSQRSRDARPFKARSSWTCPFARLDPNHTLRTLEALPAIAEQVVLIVHEGEINPSEAQNTLRSSLICERRLTRRSARHTEILKLGST